MIAMELVTKSNARSIINITNQYRTIIFQPFEYRHKTFINIDGFMYYILFVVTHRHFCDYPVSKSAFAINTVAAAVD